MTSGTQLLGARQLSFRHPGGPLALSGVDLSVGPGELVGVLGPNGSGKSTLLRLLAGLERPRTGQVDRFDPATAGASRRRTAVVLDRTPFPDDLPGGSVLRHLLRLRHGATALKVERSGRWLRRFGLEEASGRPVGGYSLGMRRKLALAEAFAAEPELLLLDEPLLGLDVPSRDRLAEALREAADRGASAVLALHDAAFAEAVCTRVIFLSDGAVVTEGPPGELVRRLGRDTVFEVRADRGGAVHPVSAPPAPLRLLGSSGARLRIASPRGSGDLPALADWLVECGVRVRAVRIREPDLEDAYLASTGRGLVGGAG